MNIDVLIQPHQTYHSPYLLIKLLHHAPLIVSFALCSTLRLCAALSSRDPFLSPSKLRCIVKMLFLIGFAARSTDIDPYVSMDSSGFTTLMYRSESNFHEVTTRMIHTCDSQFQTSPPKCRRLLRRLLLNLVYISFLVAFIGS